MIEKRTNRGGRPKAPLSLNEEERRKLEAWASRPKSTQRLACRARIILACAEGLDNKAVADRLQINAVTVGKWRKRFLDGRLQGLADEPRPGAPPSITDAVIEQVLNTTLHEQPATGPHWSTRGLAQSIGVSQTTVSRIWRALGVNPAKNGKGRPQDPPRLVERYRDVVGLSLHEPENAIVLSINEKCQVRGTKRPQPVLLMMPEHLVPRTPTHLRSRSTVLFAALNVAGRYGLEAEQRPDEFIAFLDAIAEKVPRAADWRLYISLDSDRTHTTPGVLRWFTLHPPARLQYTASLRGSLNRLEQCFVRLH
jgi:transposase